jgi:hypothetical protein
VKRESTSTGTSDGVDHTKVESEANGVGEAVAREDLTRMAPRMLAGKAKALPQ